MNNSNNNNYCNNPLIISLFLRNLHIFWMYEMMLLRIELSGLMRARERSFALGITAPLT